MLKKCRDCGTTENVVLINEGLGYTCDKCWETGIQRIPNIADIKEVMKTLERPKGSTR
jgi:hypothetical protein